MSEPGTNATTEQVSCAQPAADEMPDLVSEDDENCPVAIVTREPDVTMHWVMFAMSLAVIVIAVFLSVRGEKQVVTPIIGFALPELCTFKRTVGMDCPGCGMTRCFISLAHGDIVSAWRFNPAGILLFGMLAFQIPYRVIQLWRVRAGRPELYLQSLGQWTLIAFGVLLLAQWIFASVLALFS